MNFKLIKINNFKELTPGDDVFIFGCDDVIEAIENIESTSPTTGKVILVNDTEASIRVSPKYSLTEYTAIYNPDSYKHFNLYKVKMQKNDVCDDSDKEIFRLRRKLRKAEKRSSKYEFLLKKNNIELEQFKPVKEKEVVYNDLECKDSKTVNLYGHVCMQTTYTNDIDTVKVAITSNRRTTTQKFTCVGTAKTHEEDKFSFQKGYALAHSRAVLKFLEQIM